MKAFWLELFSSLSFFLLLQFFYICSTEGFLWYWYVFSLYCFHIFHINRAQNNIFRHIWVFSSSSSKFIISNVLALVFIWRFSSDRRRIEPYTYIFFLLLLFFMNMIITIEDCPPVSSSFSSYSLFALRPARTRSSLRSLIAFRSTRRAYRYRENSLFVIEDITSDQMNYLFLLLSSLFFSHIERHERHILCLQYIYIEKIYWIPERWQRRCLLLHIANSVFIDIPQKFRIHFRDTVVWI